MKISYLDVFSPPIFRDKEKTRKANHIYFIGKFLLVMSISIVPFLNTRGNIGLNIILFISFLGSAILPMWLAKRGKVNTAGILFIILFWSLINYSTIETGGVQAVGFGGNLLVMAMALMLINIYAVFIVAGVSSAFGFYLAYLQSNNNLPLLLDIPTNAFPAWVTQTFFLVMNASILYILINNLRRELKRAQFAEQNILILNDQLILAYDTTLEGWARALELKDKDTEGHTRRVTEMTLELGKKFAMSKEELTSIKYGAQLHDIGKMGIPDEVLNKPGKLTPSERKLIETHPDIAFQLLKSIEYLGDAIDIPYCHHEKWDGTGYPSGMKGEEIPFSARIFSVVDVWDALRSDRPYRKAWGSEKSLNYIKEQKGHHFDPQVVDQFFKMILDESFIKL